MAPRLPAALLLPAVIFLQPTVNAQSVQFESASVVAPAGESCALHPEGDTDPRHSIAIDVDADGVARFQAIRPTQPGSVGTLALDCTGPTGKARTYTVDLRSKLTFTPRPFDAVRAGLKVRPVLSGDPLSYSVGELIQQGYGLRPDPKANPAGYARWLSGVTTPYYRLRSVNPGAQPSPSPSTQPPPSATITSTSTFQPWTGAILTGSYQENSTSALTKSYLANEAEFSVPAVTPGLYGTGTAWMSIWNGLDNSNLLQAEVWVMATATNAHYIIQRQSFAPHGHTGAQGDTAGVSFTPQAGDVIYAQEWYCDATGNPNLAGGYACTYMRDDTSHVVWDCSQANSTVCASYPLTSGDLTNGNLGQSAEFVIENDTLESGPNVTVFSWPPFDSVTMSGTALVVQGSGAGSTLNQNAGAWVTAISDPSVQLAPDWTNGPSYLNISLIGTDSVVWADGPAKCPGGTFAPGGDVSCSLCAAGSSSAAGAAACSLCPAGSSSAAGAPTCSPCLAGFHSSVTGAATCPPCPAGTYSSATGAVACSACPAGFSSLGGATECLQCGVMPNPATSDYLVCSGTNTATAICIAGTLSFEAVRPPTCPINSVAKATSNWSCSTPTIPNCNVTCTASYMCTSVQPCTLKEAAAGKCTMPNPTCGHAGQKPCPPRQ